MQWLMRQARTYNDWLTPTQLMMKLDRTLNCNDNLRRSIVGCLLNSTALYRIEESGLVNNRKNYTLDTYLDDALTELFKASYQGKSSMPPSATFNRLHLPSLSNTADLRPLPVKRQIRQKPSPIIKQ